MATCKGCGQQIVWLERVGDGAECSVVIEGGHVREVRA